MPNGFHGSAEEWERIEASLRILDETLDSYARQHGLVLSRNYHNWPERSLQWGASVKRLVQIFLADETLLTFNMWLCASEDRGSERYWKQQLLRENLPIEELAKDLLQLLESAMSEVNTWSSEDLELGGTISR